MATAACDGEPARRLLRPGRGDAAHAKLPKEPGRNARNDIAAMDRILDKIIHKLDSDEAVAPDELAKTTKRLRNLKDNELMRHDLPAIGGVNFTLLFHAIWFADRNLENAEVAASNATDATGRQNARDALAKARKWLKRLHEELDPADDDFIRKGKYLKPRQRIDDVVDGIDKVSNGLDGLTPADAAKQIAALATAKRKLLNGEFPKLFGVPLGDTLFELETIDNYLLYAEEVAKKGDATAIKESARLWLDNARKAKVLIEKRWEESCGYVPEPKALRRRKPCPPQALSLPLYSTVTVATLGEGTVSVQPGGITCPQACAVDLFTGLHTTLTATPYPGSEFAAWSGACAGQGATCNLTLFGPAASTATFVSG